MYICQLKQYICQHFLLSWFSFTNYLWVNSMYIQIWSIVIINYFKKCNYSGLTLLLKEFNLMERHSVPQEGTKSQLRRTNSALFWSCWQQSTRVHVLKTLRCNSFILLYNNTDVYMLVSHLSWGIMIGTLYVIMHRLVIVFF